MSEQEFDNYLTLLSGLLKLDETQRKAVAAELRDHMEERLAALRQKGFSHQEAIREALEEFGDAAGLAGELSVWVDRKAEEQKRRWIMRLTAGSMAGVIGAILVATAFWPVSTTIPPNLVRAQPSQAGPASSQAVVVETSPDMERLRAALRETVAISFDDVSIRGVATWIEDQLKVNVEFDKVALDEESVSPEDTITFSAKQISVDAALHHMLRPLNLAHLVTPNLLIITSEAAAEAHLTTRIYPVWDLVMTTQAAGESSADYQALLEVITSTIAPSSWGKYGGAGRLTPYKGLLAVSQTEALHIETANLLAALRTFPPASEIDLKTETVRAVGPPSDPVRRKVESALAAPVPRFEFQEVPLAEVARSIENDLGIPVIADRVGLEDESVDWTTELVSTSVNDLTLGNALLLVLRDLNLTYVYAHEALVITSAEVASETLVTKVYQVASLLDHSTSASPAQAGAELDQLQNTISATVSPDSWDDVGGPGSMTSFASRCVLVISQTEPVHEQVEQLITALAKARSSQLAAPQQPPRDPLEPVVEVYGLNDVFADDPSVQKRLVGLIQRLLVDSDLAANGGVESGHTMEILADRLVVAHRPAVQVQIRGLLRKLGVLRGDRFEQSEFAGSEESGGMF